MIDTHPWGKLLTENAAEAGVYVLGVPFDLAVSCGKGAALAPEKIRYLSRYQPATTETGAIINKIKIMDVGDIPLDLNWERYYKTVEDKAFELLSDNKFCLFIGGDHSVTIPLHKAFGRSCAGKGRFGVIHFDAHCDLCDSYDGHGWSHACTERRAIEEVIRPEDLTLFGIRSYEIEELELLARHPEIKVITACDLYHGGIEQAFEEIMKRYAGYDSIYFTLDIDVLDPAFAPGTGTPEAGGLSSRQLLELVKLMVDKLPVKAMDIVEVSPSQDHSDITSWAALKIIYEVIGCLNKKRQETGVRIQNKK
ncbi:agmatinase [Desulfotomaculum arcticum]|uniref:Agmatinase n=1 Tax=Desulfotruncus arcticus DSM 17038 TaxID=1121424 RepID=A0A1I2WZH2_9FIRM|nr:agmatinase [Desulfotruncus arcticus]SFH06137.1 agmatinase [Desulfotomaculum arcticum] [Desulfotruncus arcticus DSM 17038]